MALIKDSLEAVKTSWEHGSARSKRVIALGAIMCSGFSLAAAGTVVAADIEYGRGNVDAAANYLELTVLAAFASTASAGATLAVAATESDVNEYPPRGPGQQG